MTINLLKRKTYIILFAIVFLGLVLRADNLTKYPRLGATFDEFAWTWLGISLIKEQVPSSWSSHDAYVGYREPKTYLNAKFWIVKPYLEHPPFFGIVAGSFAILRGVDNFYEVNIDKIRPLALILGVSSIVILFFLVREIYDEKIALLSSLIYATIPTVVIGSRLVQNENFFIPMFLLALFLIARFIKSKDTRLRSIAAIICGLLILSKIPWLAATLAIFAILFYKNKRNDAFKFIAIVLPFFLIFIAFGLYFNSEIFIDLWKLQLQRYALTFNSVYALFTDPFLTDRFTIDGWIYFGWFSFILLLTKDFKKNYLIILGLMSYLGVFIFAIPNEAGHGWYRYPFYPFLAVSLAMFIKEYFNKNIFLTFLFILLVGASLLELTFGVQYGFSFKVFRIFLLVATITLLPLFFKNKTVAKFSKRFNNLMLVGLFTLSFWAVLEYIDL